MRMLVIFSITLLYFSIPYAQNLEDPESMDARLFALESAIAQLDTRLAAQTAAGAGSLGTANAGLRAQSQIDTLSRRVDDLGREIGNLRRQLDAATREAAAARRDARDALSRVR